MKVHGIHIKFPHSGAVSRSKVIVEMIRDMQNHSGEKVIKENIAAMCKESNFTHFVMRDRNYHISGSFEIMQNDNGTNE